MTVEQIAKKLDIKLDNCESAIRRAKEERDRYGICGMYFMKTEHYIFYLRHNNVLRIFDKEKGKELLNCVLEL